MDRLKAMAVFVAVVDSGGFANASRKLSMLPSMVTRAVAELETHLGVPLLTRTTRNVRATDAGLRYADDCRRILAKVDEATAAAAVAHLSLSGTLTVAAPPMFGVRFLAPLLTNYLTRYPGVNAQCLFLDRDVNMISESVDVALRIGPLPDSEFHAVRVGEVRRVLVAAPSYLNRFGAPLNPRGLVNHATIFSSSVFQAPEWRLREGARAASIRIKPRLSTTSDISAISAAVAGVGITQVLDYQVADELERGVLRVVLEQSEPAPEPVSLVYPGTRLVGQKVRAFIDLAVECLQADESLNRPKKSKDASPSTSTEGVSQFHEAPIASLRPSLRVIPSSNSIQDKQRKTRRRDDWSLPPHADAQ